MKLFYGLGLALALFFLFPSSALAVDHYIASVATTALTIQQPSTGARRITFGDSQNAGASVYCASAATATLKWAGTAATATTVAEKKVIGTANASGVTIWSGSDVGTGTTGPVYNVPAGGTLNVGLSWFVLQGNGTAINITIATSGTCTITFAYSADAPR